MTLIFAFLALCCALDGWFACDVKHNTVSVSHSGQRYITVRMSDESEFARNYCLFGPANNDGFEMCHTCKIYDGDGSYTQSVFLVVFVCLIIFLCTRI